MILAQAALKLDCGHWHVEWELYLWAGGGKVLKVKSKFDCGAEA
jgi:hypothetical protein